MNGTFLNKWPFKDLDVQLAFADLDVQQNLIKSGSMYP